MAKKSGRPQLSKASNFNELVEFIYIRSESVGACYLDKLLLENTNKSISRILEEDWQPPADADRIFYKEVSIVKKHIKNREEHGWIYHKTGNVKDPIVRLIGYKPLNY